MFPHLKNSGSGDANSNEFSPDRIAAMEEMVEAMNKVTVTTAELPRRLKRHFMEWELLKHLHQWRIQATSLKWELRGLAGTTRSVDPLLIPTYHNVPISLPIPDFSGESQASNVAYMERLARIAARRESAFSQG